MFAGSYRVKVDAKGRLAVPKQFRDELSPGSYISIGPERNLTIYPREEWESLRNVLRSPLTATAAERHLSRTIFALAVPCEFDAQGRVTLSPEQRRNFGIETEKTVVVAGNQTVVEIWPEDQWNSYSAEGIARFTDNVDLVTRAT